MSFFIRLFRRKRRTRTTGFRSYRIGKPRIRKAFKPKKRVIKTRNRIEKRRQNKYGKYFRFLKVLGALALITALFYLSLFTKTFEIRTINTQGGADTLEEQKAVNDYLNEFLGENLLLFHINKHEEVLLENYPYLKKVKLKRDYLHGIVATLETYENKANIQMNYDDGSSQFFIVNELGIISTIGYTNEELPSIVMDVTGTDLKLSGNEEESTMPSLHEELIDPNILTLLIETEDTFEAKFDMQVLQVYYLKQARELHLYTERYFFVWIDLNQDIQLQLTKLKKAMAELNIYEVSLEYIDLRISGQNGERVIYKLQDNT